MRRSDELDPDLSASHDGLDGDHAVSHQAAGMVSVQMGTGLEEAVMTLRAHAFAHDSTLLQAARDVVARRISFREEMPGALDGETAAPRGRRAPDDL